MINTIKCKICGNEIEITEALKHQIEEEILASERVKHSQELEEVKKQAEKIANEKAVSKFDLMIRNLQEEAKEEKLRNKDLQEQILELTKELRKSRQDKESLQLEMQKKLAEEEDIIRLETRKQTEEEHRLKDYEKDKKLRDALIMNEELKNKLQQNSQQTQGEVLEIEVENSLRQMFPEDKIEEIKKGQKGADIKQVVVDKKSRECGIILWETKNAKWDKGWISKLKEDQRDAKAQLGVLVGTDLPKEIETYIYRDGIWITNPKMVTALSFALRFDLIHLHNEKLLNVGKNEKMEILFQYLTGIEFQHRIEAIAEAFTNLQQETEREKRWFQTKWSRQEKEIRKIIDNTYGMYGDLQAVTGRALGQIKYLEDPTKEENEVSK